VAHRAPLGAQRLRDAEAHDGPVSGEDPLTVARRARGQRIERAERPVVLGVAAHQRTVDTVLAALQSTRRTRVVRQLSRERVVREGPLEQRHGLHRAHPRRQPAQRERHQPRAETVPDEMHPHPGRRLGEPPDRRPEPPLTDGSGPPLHRVVRGLPQQFLSALPRIGQPGQRELGAGTRGSRPGQGQGELLADRRRAPREHPGVALRLAVPEEVRREPRLRRLGRHRDEEPHQRAELLQGRIAVRLFVQQPDDLLDDRGPPREGFRERVPGALVEPGPTGRLRYGAGGHGPPEVGDRLVRETHRGPHHAHIADPCGRGCEGGDRAEEPAVEPGRHGPVVVPAVCEDDEVTHLARAHLREQPVTSAPVGVPVRVERQLPVGRNTHLQIRHDEPRPPLS
jgi:hypothetical protein